MRKSLLKAFGKASARGAFPSYNSITISGGEPDKWWNSYTAPEDGYLYICAPTAEGALIEINGSVGTSGKFDTISTRGFVPVRKGETVLYAFHFTEGGFITFIPAKACV